MKEQLTNKLNEFNRKILYMFTDLFKRTVLEVSILNDYIHDMDIDFAYVEHNYICNHRIKPKNFFAWFFYYSGTYDYDERRKVLVEGTIDEKISTEGSK